MFGRNFFLTNPPHSEDEPSKLKSILMSENYRNFKEKNPSKKNIANIGLLRVLRGKFLVPMSWIHMQKKQALVNRNISINKESLRESRKGNVLKMEPYYHCQKQTIGQENMIFGSNE